MVGLTCFEDARVLPAEELRRLLAGSGDAQERVWAAWALGLSAGSNTSKETAAQAVRDPDPGVRRHLVVVLAGLGETAAVRALFRDPDPYVRATAFRYACRLAVAGTDLLEAAISDPSDIVREEGIRAPAGRWSVVLLPALGRLLDDAALGVRQAAAERLAAEMSPAETAALVARRLVVEADPDFERRLLMMLVALDGVGELVGLLPEARLARQLDILRQAKVPLPWTQLAPIAARGRAALDCRILQILVAAEDADLIWLARCAARPLSPHEADDPDAGFAAALAHPALLAKVATVAPAPLTAEERAPFLALIRQMREQLDTNTEPDDDDEYDPDWRPNLAAQRRVLATFLMQTGPGSVDRD